MLTLRPAHDTDAPFLRALFEDCLPPELAALPLPEAEKQVLVDMQYAAQRRSWTAAFPGSDEQLVLHKGAPAGRLWVDRSDSALRLVDISLRPELRGLGLGTALLTRLAEEADRGGLSIELHVAPTNPARRLYLRLGFESRGLQGPMERMERPGARPAEADEPAPASGPLPEGTFVREQFTRHLGARFPDAEGPDLVLVEVASMVLRGEFRPPRPPFTLLLEGPAEAALRQGPRRLTHPDLGEIELFLVPVGRTGDRIQYESTHC